MSPCPNNYFLNGILKTEPQARRWWRTSLIPELKRQRQTDTSVSLRPVLSTKQVLGQSEKPCLKKTKQKTKQTSSLTKLKLNGAGEMAQQLQAFSALAEDSGLVLSTDKMAYDHP